MLWYWHQDLRVLAYSVGQSTSCYWVVGIQSLLDFLGTVTMVDIFIHVRTTDGSSDVLKMTNCSAHTLRTQPGMP